MPDYTAGTGAAGTMLIRDNGPGQAVQFFIRSADSGTYIGSPGIATRCYIDGAWRPLNNLANYSNSVWRDLGGGYGASYNQTVQFQIDATGTYGLGGPTTMSAYIQRATVPAAPTMIGIDQIGHTDARVRFSGNSDGGSPIREWQVGYGYDPSNVQYTASSSGTSVIGTFTVGATIYAWARGRNDVGWGPWSSRASARLLSSGRVKVAGVWREMILYVKVAGVWRTAIIYEKKAGVWTPTTGNP